MKDMAFLMHFRHMYLRAIALAWQSTDFRRVLIDNEGKTLFDLLKTKLGGLEPLENWKFHLKFIESEQPNSPTKHYSPNAHWNKDVAGWIGGQTGDRIVVYLPLRKKPEEAEQARALADFYVDHSMIFEPTCSSSSGDLPNAPIGDLGSNVPFLELGGYLLHALALAWQNANFLEDLEVKSNDNSNFGKSEAALTRWLAYINPWNMAVVVMNAPKAEWTDRKDGKGRRWIDIPATKIVLELPEKPGNCSLSLPVALAAYNQTGPGYPFTCPG